MKVSGSTFIFLVLYVDDILLATNDTYLLVETKQMLCNHFDMKDLGEAYFVLGIKIVRDKTNHVLQLSQRAYTNRILKRFDMHNCSPESVLITTQIVLFHTLNTPGFEHFLCNNQLNWPNWHVKDLAMLLINFIAVFIVSQAMYLEDRDVARA